VLAEFLGVVHNIGRADGLEGLGLGLEAPAEVEVVVATLVGYSQRARPAHGTYHVHSLAHVPALEFVRVVEALDREFPVVLVILQLLQPLHGLLACLLVFVFLFFVLFDFLGFEEA